ncbi:hypothetical protein ABK040_004898 [Willaertia magna]
MTTLANDHYQINNNHDTLQTSAATTMGNNQTTIQEGDIERYRVKKVIIGERKTHIVLQNLNGPCPLIAIVNLLILKGINLGIENKITKNNFITNDDLIQLLADHILNLESNKSTNNVEENNNSELLHQALENLPKLKYGLDINILFTKGVQGFENIPAIFSILGIKLVHGWLINSDNYTYEILKDLTYNQAVEKCVLMNELMTAQEELFKKENSNNNTNEQEQQLNNNNTENITENNNTELSPRNVDFKSPEEMVKKLTIEQKEKIIMEGQCIHEFLNINATQLTEYGLQQLHENIGERKLAILFRNNHFSVIVKIQKAILTLCTDELLLNETNIVWESLLSVNGEVQYYLGDFTPFLPLETHAQNYDYHREVNNNTKNINENHNNNNNNNNMNSGNGSNNEEDKDFQLALQLQREEERALREQQQQQQQMQMQQQQQQRQTSPYSSPQMNQMNNGSSSSTSGGVVNPYQTNSNIPHANLPTIRQQRQSESGNVGNKQKYGATGKYQNSAEQLRKMNMERQEREQIQKQTNPEGFNQKVQDRHSKNKNSRKKEDDGCIIC